MSASPAIFFTLGILLSFCSCIVLVSCSPHSASARNSRSNCSFWYGMPMSSGGSRYVYTFPVLRSNSKFDVLKNSLNRGQLNNILPSGVSSRSLSFIRLPTLVLHKSGTYQSRAMVLCCHMNSLMASSLVLCNSTVGFMLGLVHLVVVLDWLRFLYVAPWLSLEHLYCYLLTSLSKGWCFFFLSTCLFCWLSLFFCNYCVCLFSLICSVPCTELVCSVCCSCSNCVLFFLRNFPTFDWFPL